MKTRKVASIFLLIALSSPLQTTGWAQAAMAHTSVPASEPQNLGLLKDKLKAYHDCCYASGLAQQDQVALAYLERRAAHKRPAEKLALVLDIERYLIRSPSHRATCAYGCSRIVPRE